MQKLKLIYDGITVKQQMPSCCARSLWVNMKYIESLKFFEIHWEQTFLTGERSGHSWSLAVDTAVCPLLYTLASLVTQSYSEQLPTTQHMSLSKWVNRVFDVVANLGYSVWKGFQEWYSLFLLKQKSALTTIISSNVQMDVDMAVPKLQKLWVSHKKYELPYAVFCSPTQSCLHTLHIPTLIPTFVTFYASLCHHAGILSSRHAVGTFSALKMLPLIQYAW